MKSEKSRSILIIVTAITTYFIGMQAYNLGKRLYKYDKEYSNQAHKKEDKRLNW